MKRTDIVIGTDYAVHLYGGIGRTRAGDPLTSELAERAVVIEMGSAEIGTGNVRVRTKPGRGHTAIERVVPLRNIVGTWAEREERVAARKANNDAAIERMRADVAAIRAIIPAPENAYEGPLSEYSLNDEVHADGSFGTNVHRLSYAELRQIVEAAYAAGRASVTP